MAQQPDYAALARQFGGVPAPSHQPSAQETPRMGSGYRGPTGHDTSVPTDVALGRVRDAAPAIGGITAAMLTGGASIPVQLAATGAGTAIGQAVKDAPEDMPLSDRFSNMAFEGLKSAALQGGVIGLTAAAPRMVQLARNLWNRSAKVPETIARTTQTMQRGGSLPEGKDEIAETVLSEGAGTLRRGNLDALRESMAGIDDAIDNIVRNSSGMVSRQELRVALQQRRAAVPRGTQAGAAEVAAIDRTMEQLNKLPAKMTVAKAQEMKRYIYQAYEKTYAADVTQQVTAAADKTVARSLRREIAKEEPDVTLLDQQMSRLIPAAKAVDRAVSRGANHNPVTLSQQLAGVVTNPATVAAALINHPKIGSFSAQQIYNAANRLPKAARTAANIIRLASAMTPAASHTQTGRD